MSAFHRIEKNLANGIADRFTFSKLVKIASEKNAVVRKYKNDLLEYADLRNAIVHERTDPNFAIAEPHLSTVKAIEKIEMELVKPKKVIPIYQKEVKAFRTSDSLAKMLSAIHKTEITQFPVYDGKRFCGLVSPIGITNWLATTVDEDLMSRNDTTLNEILNCEENKTNYKFLPKQASIYEAEELFKEELNRGKRIEAILITENGLPNEKLLGIITTSDIVHQAKK